MPKAKIEQDRFIFYTETYYTSSEQTSVAGSDLLSAQTAEKTARMNANAAPAGGTTPQAKANKTITSRRTTLGKSTVTKPAMKKLKQGATK